jgi:hypothetical protein
VARSGAGLRPPLFLFGSLLEAAMSHNLQHLMTTVFRPRGVSLPHANHYAGAWFHRLPATIDGIVYDERRGLGTARPVQPRRAMSFNGTNQYGWIAIDPVTSFPFSVFGWARKSTTTIEDLCGISASSSSTQYYSFRIDDGGRVGLNRRNTTIVFTEVSVPLLSDQWISYVCVFDSATTAKIYRNGILVGDLSGLTSVDVGATFNRFQFATRSQAAPTVYLNGIVQHCGYTRTAATLADALAFHETGIMPNAERQFLLDDNSTTVARDIITGAEATIVNGAAGMLYTGRDVKFSRQNDVGYSLRTNLFVNTGFVGAVAGTPGTVPTGWTLAGNTGTTVSYDSATGKLRYSAVAQRQYIQQTFNIPINSTRTVSVRVNVTTTAQVQQVVNMSSAAPAGGSIIWRVNGSVVSAVTSLPLGESLLEAALTTTTDVWTGSFRIGVGVAGNVTANIEFWEPQGENGSIKTTYQSIGTDPGSSVLFPAILNGTTSAAGDTLQFSGPVPMNAQAEEANCFTFDGTDDYIAMDLNDVAGPELVTNGTFATDTDWTKGGGWTISGGAANFTATGVSSTTSQLSSSLIPGKSYLCTYTLTRSAGNLSISFSGGTTVNGTLRSATGTYTEILVAVTGNNLIRFTAGTTFTGTLDNISVKELPTLTNQGTSVISYRSDGLGITGTAGTAYDIRLGDVGWIPCSEGSGGEVSDVLTDTIYQIMNGQASNWTTKQDTFHYNLFYGFYNDGGVFIPASQINPGMDTSANDLSNPPVVGHNGPESTINFSPVSNSWHDTYSIPGADLPNYAFDGDPGDINILINTATREAKFRLENL